MRSLLVLVALCATAAADPLTVTIKPASTTWRVKVPVDVALEVANSSKTPQTIKVWLCSWGDNWKSSDPELTWSPWSCDKNYEKSEVLAPGATRTWTLAMYADPAAKLGAHTLRLGFSGAGKVQWSNDVAITVGK